MPFTRSWNAATSAAAERRAQPVGEITADLLRADQVKRRIAPPLRIETLGKAFHGQVVVMIDHARALADRAALSNGCAPEQGGGDQPQEGEEGAEARAAQVDVHSAERQRELHRRPLPP